MRMAANSVSSSGVLEMFFLNITPSSARATPAASSAIAIQAMRLMAIPPSSVGPVNAMGTAWADLLTRAAAVLFLAVRSHPGDT